MLHETDPEDKSLLYVRIVCMFRVWLTLENFTFLKKTDLFIFFRM